MFGIEPGAIIVGGLLLISAGVVVINLLGGLPPLLGRLPLEVPEELAAGVADAGLIVGEAGPGGADGGGAGAAGAGGGD